MPMVLTVEVEPQDGLAVAMDPFRLQIPRGFFNMDTPNAETQIFDICAGVTAEFGTLFKQKLIAELRAEYKRRKNAR